MAYVFDSMIFSLESPARFTTCKHTGPLSLAKCLVLRLRFSSSWPSACFISSKNSLFSTPISSCLATSPTKSYPQEEENGELFNNDITEFILKECGVSESQLPTIHRKMRIPLSQRKSLHTAQQALQFIRDLGLTPHQVRTVIRKYPNALTHKVDLMKSKIDLLTTLGLTREDLAVVIVQHPRILGLSLEKNISPKIQLLANLFGSEDHLSQAIRRSPGILCSDKNVTRNVARKSKQMRSIGLLENEIKDMFKKVPRLLCVTTKTLDKKLKHVANLGLTEEEIKEVLARCPMILTMSVDKIQKNMDFLTHTAGFEANIVCTYPTFLMSSIENRLKPRFMLYKYLTVNQSSKCLNISLATVLNLCDEGFYSRFLNDPHIGELYESYMSKQSDTALSG